MSDHTTTVHDSITAVDRNQWNNLIEQSDLGTAFHRFGWLRAIEEGLDREARHVVVTTNGNPVAVLPNVTTALDVPVSNGVVSTGAKLLPTDRLVSLHPGYGGPVIASEPAANLDRLFDAVEKAGNGDTLAHKLRIGTGTQFKYSKYLTGRGYEPSVVSCRFVLDLRGGWADIEAGMSRTRRNALDSTDEVTVSRDGFDADNAAGIHTDYARNMDRVDGTVYPLHFFERLAETFADRLVVFSATTDEERIGSYVCVADEEQSTLRYFFSAIPSESAYEYDVSERLHAAAIKWAIDEGYDSYDLGATGADHDDGLFRYKEQYGGEIKPIVQWDSGLSPVAWGAFKLGRRLYRATSYGD